MDFRTGTEELQYCGNRFGLAHSTYISQFQILPSVESTLYVPSTKAKRIRNHFTKEMNPVGNSIPLFSVLYGTFFVEQGLRVYQLLTLMGLKLPALGNISRPGASITRNIYSVNEL
jgi:hypothetical protein